MYGPGAPGLPRVTPSPTVFIPTLGPRLTEVTRSQLPSRFNELLWQMGFPESVLQSCDLSYSNTSDLQYSTPTTHAKSYGLGPTWR